MSSYYNEEHDPLLPNGPKAPEISSRSRPEGLNHNDSNSVPDSRGGIVEEKRQQETSKDFLTVLLKLCFVLGAAYILLPINFLSGVLPGPIPLTIDQRVTKILSNTPLIGENTSDPFNSVCPLQSRNLYWFCRRGMRSIC